MSGDKEIRELRVGIAGLGAVGTKLVEQLDQGIHGLRLTAVAARDKLRAAEKLRGVKGHIAIVDIAELAEHADIVIECAPAELVGAIAEPVLRAGKTVIVLSCGALLDRMDLVDLARAHGGQIIVPTGALLGLDAVTAAAEGTIHSVRMITRKPVRGLVGAPFLVNNNIDIEDVTEPLKIFSGTAREAAKGFPANLNVVVALALAGIGPDRTQLEIWADPALTRNTHEIEVDSDAASFSLRIQNIPTENPKTGRITAQSVLAVLRKLRSPLRVGT
ncbi:aspartate dehydrogenase [Cupriavidus plantarum]|uniref:L-aspartate dehydrogenase n=1 Tax=Cupriavidus plantarum TaxID=942865 RepID=A0A316EXC2_9BURK|nr:aspartate dehydrogenase [Cupriavidus plantarum]NYI00192.1 aspartate dehydrogenase [Cupriavidus plantarum]PWK37374.1 aspartate dehydrogenase [Cupriavidus plantarum]REF01883.1 aspartate dehydrogenase [Cupriavidus plantarum]RLK45265.1 aspartate dehydrogenase [Cupriavidus plantarum]CAG2128745.1 L-aspartate dehydrogenase [Cupriavidus plantarum]